MIVCCKLYSCLVACSGLLYYPREIKRRYYNVFHRIAVITDAVRFSVVCARTILFDILKNCSFHHNRLAIHCHYCNKNQSKHSVTLFLPFQGYFACSLRYFPCDWKVLTAIPDDMNLCLMQPGYNVFPLSCFSCLLSFPLFTLFGVSPRTFPRPEGFHSKVIT